MAGLGAADRGVHPGRDLLPPTFSDGSPRARLSVPRLSNLSLSIAVPRASSLLLAGDDTPHTDSQARGGAGAAGRRARLPGLRPARRGG